MLKIKQSSNGMLRLSIGSKEDRQELREQYTNVAVSENDIWYELFEPYFTNGQYYPIDPETYNVGLTSDPYIVAEDVTYDDIDGQINGIIGKMWHCPEYQIISVVERLIEDGEYYLTEVQ